MPPLPLPLRFSLWVARAASKLAPKACQEELKRNWEAELIYHWQREVRGPGAFFLWSFGAFRHAWYLLRTEYTVDNLIHDLKSGLRSLKRSRGIIAIAVLSLGIGIGANAAIFSMVDVFMTKPLPYPESERLHVLRLVNHERRMNHDSYSAPDFLDIREQSRTLEVVATRTQPFNLSGDVEALRLSGTYVTPGFFDLLGVTPFQGRAFSPEEGVPGNDRVAIISHELWQSRFGADPDMVGHTIVLNALPHTVVGIVPPHFWYRFPGNDVWVPLAFTGEENRGSYLLNVLARLRPGSTIEQTREEGTAIMDRIAAAYPQTSEGNEFDIETLHAHIFDEDFVAGSIICTVAAGLLLLIACANAANLLLTHAAGRDREVAVRGALGAGRSRIVRQFLTEALVVAAVGGIVGMGFAVFGIRGLVGILPPEMPRTHEMVLSPRVFVFTASVTLLTAIIFGLAPALFAARSDFVSAFHEGGQWGTSVRREKIRRGLAGAEVAMAMVLLISSALLLKGIQQVRLESWGFDGSDVMAMRIALPEAQYPDTTAVNNFHRNLAPRLRAIPGVRGVGGSNLLPAQGVANTHYVLGDEDWEDEHARRRINCRYILPGYFGAMDIPVLQGRTFRESDRLGSTPVAVISESVAHQNWPDEDPIGRIINSGQQPREIVGVVADVREPTRDSGNRADMVYFAALQSQRRFMEWTIEADVPLQSLSRPVKAAVRGLDPTIPAYDVMTLNALIGERMAGGLIMAKITGVVAIIALILALGGVLGVTAFSVSQRTREFGIRISLGAPRASVMGMVVRQGTLVALVGIAGGVVIAVAVTRGLSAFLLGVNPLDPLVFSTVALVLMGTGVVATIPPALRATRVDPVEALREE